MSQTDEIHEINGPLSSPTGLARSDLEALACLFPAVHGGRVFDDSDGFVAHCQDVQEHVLWCEHLPLLPLQIVDGDSRLGALSFPTPTVLNGDLRDARAHSRRLSPARGVPSDRPNAAISIGGMFEMGSSGEIGDFLHHALIGALGPRTEENTPTFPAPPSAMHADRLQWFTLLYGELREGARWGSRQWIEGAFSVLKSHSKGGGAAEPNAMPGALPAWVQFGTALGVADRMARQLSASRGDRPGEEPPKAPGDRSGGSEGNPFVDWTALCSVSAFVYRAVKDFWGAMIGAGHAGSRETAAHTDPEGVHAGCEVRHRPAEAEDHPSESLWHSFDGLFCRSVSAWLSRGGSLLPTQPPTTQGAESKAQNGPNRARPLKKPRSEFSNPPNAKCFPSHCGFAAEADPTEGKTIVQRLAAALAIPLALYITQYMRCKEVAHRLQQLANPCEGARGSPLSSASTSIEEETGSSGGTPFSPTIDHESPTHGKDDSPSRSVHRGHSREPTTNDNCSSDKRRRYIRAKRKRALPEWSFQRRAKSADSTHEHANSEDDEEAVNHHQRFMDLLLLLFLHPAGNTSDA
ncbi:unnamed protein product [Phytomonas sp. Hart1]|nr:unnamed protein product [Phytomonas sp. Hart1]|eukprot:CCW68837.1 unnamed protein product [Phytomonas sp. isolate Hart1]